MFKRILIANRGEIALRIIRACKEMGLQTVVVCSQADKGARYLDLADHAICIGPAPAMDSYLSVSRVISAAEISDSQAIHPGYGFLAENSHFAEVCQSCGVKFIGPTFETMEKVGNKSLARQVAAEARVHVVPGSMSTLQDVDEALGQATEIGYPVMLKAASGGGGRGLRRVDDEEGLGTAFAAAGTEAQNAFKDSSLYIEKVIEPARHVEIQILADEHGNIVSLGERDCTVQRRHQKLIEETPSPFITKSLREEMSRAAVRIAKAVDYTGAGTVEFLVDEKKRFYFLEVNARVQVEHPVTEMVTGFDIIKEQIRIAAGEKLEVRQRDIVARGVSIECRINAEDPDDGFRPTPGRIIHYFQPGGIGVRVDSHIHSGYVVPTHYDSLIAKLIVHAPTRKEAVVRMRRALGEFVIEGPKTTIPFLLAVLNHKDFVKADIDTGFLNRFFDERAQLSSEHK